MRKIGGNGSVGKVFASHTDDGLKSNPQHPQKKLSAGTLGKEIWEHSLVVGVQ